ncbi:DNA replication regulator SLD3-domain-containing protein [Scheffersomyces coipomensis]|uniref:DNA replication regulator SLD3-domain-containing protein n=1 Tax=Scheffersomyces coipomensis TaxID=1788519 RepID=UPI00315C5A3E
MEEDGDGEHHAKRKRSPVKLPLTFEIQSLESESEALVLTVVQKANGIVFAKFNHPFLTSLDKQTVLFQSPVVHDLLNSLNTYYFYVLIKKDVRDRHQETGLMFNIKDQFYGIFKCPNFSLKSISLSSQLLSQSVLTFEEFSKIQIDSTIQKNPINNHASIIEQFDMSPPTSESPVKQIENNSSEEDPLTFMYNRYFEMLYSLNTPLSYFPKSTISRFRNLCNNKGESTVRVLEMLFLSVEQFDDRHNGKFGILNSLEKSDVNIDEVSLRDSIESSIQVDFKKKNQDLMYILQSSPVEVEKEVIPEKESPANGKKVMSREERLQRLVLELKIREAQLQLIILCELLNIWHIAESDFLSNNEKKQRKEVKKKEKESKPSLVRKKKSNKKIVPTFLGMGVNVQLGSSNMISEEKGSINEYMAYVSMNAVLDRLGLWDTLLGRSNDSKNNGTMGFLAYVLVPYYNKKLPVIIKHIIDRIKDSNMKVPKPIKESKSKKGKSADASDTADAESGKADPSQDSMTSSSKSTKFKKVLLSRKSAPVLKKASTSGLVKDDNLMPAFSLKRSASNLSSKNLKKRVVDMSVNLKSFNDNNDSNKSTETLRRSKSLSEKSGLNSTEGSIFTNIKRKSQVIPQDKISVSQVEATPVKAKSTTLLTQVEATPKLSVPFNLSATSYSQVAATPTVGSRTVPIEEVIDTPDVRFLRPDSTQKPRPSLYNKLVESSDVKSESNSPFVFSDFRSPKKLNCANITSPTTMIHTTPTQVINSSPFGRTDSSRRKDRPGAPASIQDSPFYNPALNGSPTAFRLEDAKENNKPIVSKSMKDKLHSLNHSFQ